MTRAEELAELRAQVRSRFAPIDGTATREIERLDGLEWDEADAALSELVAEAVNMRRAYEAVNRQRIKAEADAEALAEERDRYKRAHEVAAGFANDKLIPRAEKAEADAEALAEALVTLANEAARACTEPRRFHENEDRRQQALGNAAAHARLTLARYRGEK